MRKIWFNLLILAALLAGCSQASPASPTVGATKDSFNLQSNGGTAAPAIATRDPNAKEMTCQIVSLSPTAGATQESMFPSPGKDDWIQGNNPDATLTILEYSDFQ